MRPSNENLVKVMDYARKLLFLADRGDIQREDPECGVLYGLLRDSAYRVKKAAEEEIEHHKRMGLWDEETREKKTSTSTRLRR